MASGFFSSIKPIVKTGPINPSAAPIGVGGFGDRPPNPIFAAKADSIKSGNKPVQVPVKLPDVIVPVIPTAVFLVIGLAIIWVLWKSFK